MSALYTIPGQRAAARAAGRSAASSTPAAACRCPCSIGRNDIVYVDGAGIVWNNPAADRTAVINTPGGGVVAQHAPAGSGSGRRSVHQGRRAAVPEPGGVRDAGARARSATSSATRFTGPSFRQIDMVVAKRVGVGGRGPNAEFRVEIFNLFNNTNFANPVGTLPNALPTGDAGTAPRRTRVQPGQPFTSAAAGTFGRLTQHRRHDRRPRHEPPGAVRVPVQLLTAHRQEKYQGPLTADAVGGPFVFSGTAIRDEVYSEWPGEGMTFTIRVALASRPAAPTSVAVIS